MHGSPKAQLKYVFESSGVLQLGAQRHAAKTAARATGARSAEQIAKLTGVYSHSTHRAYFKRGTELLKFCKSVYKVRSFDKIQPEHVRGFLENKIRSGVSYRTFQQYAAALGKIETALSKMPQGYAPEWSSSIKEARSVARETLDKTIHPRAYDDPAAVVREMTGDNRIVSTLQHQAGLRVSEAAHIKADQLKGTTIDELTGEKVGRLSIQGKGGLVRDIKVPLDVYRELETKTNDGTFKADIREYRNQLKTAAEATGQTYDRRSTHGLRWNFAQQQMDKYTQSMSYEEALLRTSHDLGHKRPSITEHYLKR